MLVDKLRQYFQAAPAASLPLDVSKFPDGNIIDALRTALRSALFSEALMVINADDVARYFATAREQYAYTLESGALNLAPPAFHCWTEWSPQQICTWFIDPRHQTVPPKRVGMLIIGFPASIFRDRMEQIQIAPAMLDGAAWITEHIPIVELAPVDAAHIGQGKGSFNILLHRLRCALDDHGVPMGHEMFAPPSCRELIENEPDFHQWVSNQWIQATKIPFLTLSLLHSKNVTLCAHESRPAQQKARRKAGKLPFLRFHTLHVHPTSTRSRAPRLPAEHLPTALHMVRGHFADYRDGVGLFGKLHGLYWIPQHVRGDASVGLLQKTYEIHPLLLGKD